MSVRKCTECKDLKQIFKINPDLCAPCYAKVNQTKCTICNKVRILAKDGTCQPCRNAKGKPKAPKNPKCPVHSPQKHQEEPIKPGAKIQTKSGPGEALPSPGITQKHVNLSIFDTEQKSEKVKSRLLSVTLSSTMTRLIEEIARWELRTPDDQLVHMIRQSVVEHQKRLKSDSVHVSKETPILSKPNNDPK